MGDGITNELQISLDAWNALAVEERVTAFQQLPYAEKGDFFLALSARDQAELILSLAPGERRIWMRLLPPDDATDLIQEAPEEERPGLLALMDDYTRREVAALLAYAEDEAGGLMSPRFARLRPDMTADEAIAYLRRQAQQVETIHYAYVLYSEQHLLALPIVDKERRMKGIVTVDDIVNVVAEEASEDIQKIGGMEALEGPYLQVRFPEMVKKRGGWLAALFLGEMLTATAMGFFEQEIARAVVLALFIPLIISSGGNSGSQATSLVIR